MKRLLSFVANTRFLVLIPVVGLIFLAATLFVLGGFNLVIFVFETLANPASTTNQLIYEIVEFIHFFLIGTVLYITGMGLFQLFIIELDLPEWLRIDDIEELELNLVGVVIVVIGVNFLSVILNPGDVNLLNYGIGYAFPIAALAFFMLVRTSHQTAKRHQRKGDLDDSNRHGAEQPDKDDEP
jgi:uncharacterized membrane protein YqhA